MKRLVPILAALALAAGLSACADPGLQLANELRSIDAQMARVPDQRMERARMPVTR